VRAYDASGGHIGGLDCAFYRDKFKYGLWGMTRHDLQSTLLEGAVEGKDLQLGKQCVAVEEVRLCDDDDDDDDDDDGGGDVMMVMMMMVVGDDDDDDEPLSHDSWKDPAGFARVRFADGTAVEADLVIGADGGRSATAAYVTGKTGDTLLK
jgi:hypothetical protein